MTLKKWFFLTGLFFSIFMAFIAQGAEVADKESKQFGFLDLNYYYDFRHFNVYTIYTLVPFSENWSYFSLVNYESPLATSTAFETESFYTEQNATFSPWKNFLSFNLQAALVSGTDNDALRAAVVVSLDRIDAFNDFFRALHGWYSIYFHLLQVDSTSEYQWQIEHVYRFQLLPSLLDNRAYLAGFFDHNIGPGTTNVTAHRVGFRVLGGLYLTSEYRYVGFYPDDKRSGFRAGLEFASTF